MRQPNPHSQAKSRPSNANVSSYTSSDFQTVVGTAVAGPTESKKKSRTFGLDLVTGSSVPIYSSTMPEEGIRIGDIAPKKKYKKDRNERHLEIVQPSTLCPPYEDVDTSSHSRLMLNRTRTVSENSPISLEVVRTNRSVTDADPTSVEGTEMEPERTQIPLAAEIAELKERLRELEHRHESNFALSTAGPNEGAIENEEANPHNDSTPPPGNGNESTGTVVRRFLSSYTTVIFVVLVVLGCTVLAIVKLVMPPPSGNDNVPNNIHLFGTSNPTPFPTISLHPTMYPSTQPSDAPTASPRVYLLQTLLDISKFSNVQEWDAYLIENAATPQALAIDWLLKNDDASFRATMSTQRLRERYALVILYFATEGWDWDRTGLGYFYPSGDIDVCKWNTEGDDYSGVNGSDVFLYCRGENWECRDQILGYNGGILCDTAGQVNVLNMPVVAGGTFPSELVLLEKVVYVDFSYGVMYGTFPTELSLLPNLMYLDLSHNLFSGWLPNDVSEFSALKYLWISNNILSGPLPSMLPPSLETFSIKYNDMTGALPNEWGKSNTVTNLSTVDVSNNNLEGPIPSEWGSFRSLAGFDASFNKLNGTIPSTIGLMTGLSSLDLSDNYFTGTLPSEIGYLSQNLKSIYAYSNELEGPIPSEWGNLVSLRAFDASSNRLNGTIPSTIGLMTGLYWLDLSQNYFTGTLPTEIGYISQNLVEFDVSVNDFEGTIPSTIGLLTSLSSLDLSDNHFYGTLPSEIGYLSQNLESIYAYSNELEGPIPSEWGNLASLRFLDVISNRLNETIPTTFGLLTRLSRLNLGHNHFTGTLPSEIGNLSSLYYFLGVYDNDFSGSLPSEIGKLSELTALNIHYNPRLTGALPTEYALMTNLQIFSIHNTGLTGSLDSLFCDKTQTISLSLYADCLGDNPEIECSCCDYCCSMENTFCECSNGGVYPCF